MLSPQDILLQYVAFVYLDNLYTIIAFTLLHGVFILLVSISTTSLLRRGIGSNSRWAMLFLTLISFAIATMYWAAFFAFLTIQIRSLMVHNNLDVPLEDNYERTNNNSYRSQTVMGWSSGLLPIIGNVVVIWRAWILFENRRAMFGPLVLLLATFATTLGYVGAGMDFNSLVMISSNTELNLSSGLWTASLVLSLATNALTSSMIGYKLWTHRISLMNMLDTNKRQSRGRHILDILVESGVVFFIFQFVIFVLALIPSAAPGSTKDIAIRIFNETYLELTAMYPTAVVLLVNRQHSFLETCRLTNVDIKSVHVHQYTASARPATVGHLSFAVNNTKSTKLLESQNTQSRTDGELVTLERDVESADVDIEKRQARTAPF